jgi:hypothetical protein
MAHGPQGRRSPHSVTVVGIDADAAVLAAARRYLDPERTTLL